MASPRVCKKAWQELQHRIMTMMIVVHVMKILQQSCETIIVGMASNWSCSALVGTQSWGKGVHVNLDGVDSSKM